MISGLDNIFVDQERACLKKKCTSGVTLMTNYVNVLYVSSLLTGDRRSHTSHLTVHGHVAEDCMVQVKAAMGWIKSSAMKPSATRPWAVR